MIRVRYSIVQKAALISHRTRFTTAQKQYHRMRTAHRRMRYETKQITAVVVNVMLYAIISNFFADPGAVK